MSKRLDFVNKAITYLDRNEADGSHKAIIDLYNSITPLPVGYKVNYTDDWCATFVSAVAKACGMTGIVFPECGCERMIKLYQKAGRWQENDAYTPQPGDIIFYDWGDSGVGNNTGFADHVGIVVAVNGTVIKLIEGNLSNKVGYRNLLINGKYIRGYGLPDFEGGSAKLETAQPSPAVTAQETGITVKLTQLAKGSKGAQVKSMQTLLIRKFSISCGTSGADGDFGNGTLTAVKTFQRRKGLEADGICGHDTWSALLVG
jgi:peptidoglycan hydrolase-like protein with peptidoglycan-binding domain